MQIETIFLESITNMNICLGAELAGITQVAIARAYFSDEKELSFVNLCALTRRRELKRGAVRQVQSATGECVSVSQRHDV